MSEIDDFLKNLNLNIHLLNMVKLTGDIDYIDVITNKILNDILFLRQKYNIVQRNNKIIENEIKTTIGIQQIGNMFKSDENENKNKMDDKVDEKK